MPCYVEGAARRSLWLGWRKSGKSSKKESLCGNVVPDNVGFYRLL